MIDFDSLVLAPCEDAFGEPATYSPAAGAPFAIVGVYDEAYRDLTVIDDSTGNTTEIPVLGVRLSQFPTGTPPDQGDMLTIQRTGETFVIKEVRPDGHGWAKLTLNFAGRS